MHQRGHLFLAGLVVALSATAGAPAQTLSPIILKTAQRWTPPLAGHESRIEFCPSPGTGAAISSQVVLDDWVCPQSGPIIRVNWWGEVSLPEQAFTEYYIAIYLDNGKCQPGDLLYTACVTPDAKVVGQNCAGLRVWRFSAFLANPFSQTAGEHYWLQISENDELSVKPGSADFWWSAHRPIEKCSAVSRDAAGATITPLLNRCDDREDDLAFALWSRTIHIIILWPVPLDPVLRLKLADPSTGEVLEMQCIMPANTNAGEHHEFFVHSSLPDGDYEYWLDGMGVVPIHGSLTLVQGQETVIEPGPIRPGDLNGMGGVSVADLLLLLAAWGPPL